ncbi:unnamed protein product [Ectocarpus sp. 4 AP-2014]|uniref:ESV-1-84 n=1 Tax=Ectocarpus siliculosus virus 1 (isolate New Zealand/Kaikoura/1988) TaxID=654926 RepID=Q8QNI9_ESV1K|nr:ESV-1-84 [Ectocarpus siliculosus virus 1]AAF61573.2 ESV-1-84 [Ectocarpus siliculosus virus 1]
MLLGLKKNLLFIAYLFFNALLTLLLLGFDYGYIIVSIFVVGGHFRDVINVAYQLLHMHRILRRCADIPEDDAKIVICCLVPVYNEKPSMLKKNLDALTTQKLSENTKLVVMLLFDGLNNHNADLFNAVVDAIGLDTGCGEEQWFPNWKSKLLKKLVYKIGIYNDTSVILSYKENNSGKKDSLIIGENFIVLGIPRIESLDVRQVDFIYHTDGDTISDENCLNEMVKSLVDDPDLDGVSGLLRTYLKDDATCSESAFVAMQDFQYFFSIVVRRMTESIMNSTTCLPGCSNMIRISEKTHAAIEKYGNLPVKKSGLVQTVTRMQGTDRRYTTLLLRQGSKLQMNWRAFVHTEPPLNATAFVNQRRRWSSNSFFNSMITLYSNNIPMYIKLSNLVDIARVFTTIFRVISYLCFWVYVKNFSLVNIVFFSIFIALPYLYAFAWIFCIVPEWKQMIAGFFLNKIFTPFLSVIAVTKMFFTSTDFAWGSTRLTPPDAAS